MRSILICILTLLTTNVLSEVRLGHSYLSHFDSTFKVDDNTYTYNNRITYVSYTTKLYSIMLAENSFKYTGVERFSGYSLVGLRHFNVLNKGRFSVTGDIGGILYGPGYPIAPVLLAVGITSRYMITNRLAIETVLSPKFMLVGFSATL